MSSKSSKSKLNYANFEIFGYHTAMWPEAGKHHSAFIRFTRGNYHVHMHIEDSKRAERSYLKTLHDPKARTAVKNPEPMNSYDLQEYLLYGETWIFKEYHAVDGQRQFLVGMKDHFGTTLKVFQVPNDT